VNALIKANKKFDLLFVSGGGHGATRRVLATAVAGFLCTHLARRRTARLE
jgi:hypothetical protein